MPSQDERLESNNFRIDWLLEPVQRSSILEGLLATAVLGCSHSPESDKFALLKRDLSTAVGREVSPIFAEPLVDEDQYKFQIRRASQIATAKSILIPKEWSSGSDILVKEFIAGHWVPNYKLNDETLLMPGNEVSLLETIYHNLNRGDRKRRVVSGFASTYGTTDEAVTGIIGKKAIEFDFDHLYPAEVAVYLWGQKASSVIRTNVHLQSLVKVSDVEMLYKNLSEELAGTENQAPLESGVATTKVMKVNGGIDFVHPIVSAKINSIEGIDRKSPTFDLLKKELFNLLLGGNSLRVASIGLLYLLTNSNQNLDYLMRDDGAERALRLAGIHSNTEIYRLKTPAD